MLLKDQLLQTNLIETDGQIFQQRNLPSPAAFENNYITLRQKEAKLYSDDVVSSLPLSPQVSNRKEWKVRSKTAVSLLAYLKNHNTHRTIMELGCGNGWLSNYLARSLNGDVCGIDINRTELKQAGRVFGGQRNLIFLCADIMTVALPPHSFDVIILAASIQYFPEPQLLIGKLLQLLRDNGEIHIVDSPLYKNIRDAKEAQARSTRHFDSIGVPQMTQHYFHHTYDEFRSYPFQVKFNPHTFISKLKTMLLRKDDSAFPWIIITKGR